MSEGISVSRSVLSDSVTPWTVACQAPLSMEFFRQEYCSGSHSLLQGIFPTQGLNPGFLHCRRILYHLSHQGSPIPNCYSWRFINGQSRLQVPTRGKKKSQKFLLWSLHKARPWTRTAPCPFHEYAGLPDPGQC